LDGVAIRSEIQDKLIGQAPRADQDFLSIPTGSAKAMLFHLGQYAKRAYIYLSDDDSSLKEARLRYKDANGHFQTLTDSSYPFEFTVPLIDRQRSLEFTLTVIDHAGNMEESNLLRLGGN
jgi:hypothetical protein